MTTTRTAANEKVCRKSVTRPKAASCTEATEARAACFGMAGGLTEAVRSVVSIADITPPADAEGATEAKGLFGRLPPFYGLGQTGWRGGVADETQPVRQGILRAGCPFCRRTAT